MRDGPPAPMILPFPALESGVLVRRYHRFLADVRLADGTIAVCHCVNPGQMEGLVELGARCWISRATTPGRKLDYTWELMEHRGQLVGVNTAIPNRFVENLFARRILPGFGDHRGVQREVKYGERSRVDFVVEEPTGTPHHVEVKNCHLVYPDGGAYFPDSVSARAAHHLAELATIVRKGGKSTVLFVVQRTDATVVRPSELHDPEFAKAARRAARMGVQFRAVVAIPSVEGLSYGGELPVDVARHPVAPLRAWKAGFMTTSGWERPPKQKEVEPAS